MSTFRRSALNRVDAKIESGITVQSRKPKMPNKNSFSQWLATSPFFSVPRRTTWRVIKLLLAQRNMMAVPKTDNTARAADYSLIRNVISETDMLLLQDEAYQVVSSARATAKVQGD